MSRYDMTYTCMSNGNPEVVLYMESNDIEDSGVLSDGYLSFWQRCKMEILTTCGDHSGVAEIHDRLTGDTTRIW